LISEHAGKAQPSGVGSANLCPVRDRQGQKRGRCIDAKAACGGGAKAARGYGIDQRSGAHRRRRLPRGWLQRNATRSLPARSAH